MVGRPAFDHLPDSEQQWQPHYFEQMLTAQWPHNPGSGMQTLDINFVDSDGQNYIDPYRHNQGPIPSPNVYEYPSDMDTEHTPSDIGHPESEAYARPHIQTSYHLQLPGGDRRHSGAMHSPHSSHSGGSPYEAPISSPQIPIATRPNIERSNTAPEQRLRTSTVSSGGHSAKVKSNSDADDDDYQPNEEVKPPRGRKRQRIPHTAVERRYRENLNAHLDRLRQAVPSLAARKGPGAGKGMEGGEGVKPSKCEILNGAIEHIQGLDKQIMDLRNENQKLVASMEQMQHWYRANSR